MSEERGNERRTVHIVGAGGVGFWLAVGLARTPVDKVIYDDDNLAGGLGHTRLPNATSSTLKVKLLEGFLRVNFGGQMPVFKAERFTGNEVRPDDLVVDCSDMPGTARRQIWQLAERNGARLLRVSYDGAASTVVIAEGMPLTGNERAAGYASVPSLGLSLAAGGLGAEVVIRMLNADLNIGYVEYSVNVAEYVPVREVEGPATRTRKR